MTRPGIRCPACGEEMPRGMASCRYCRAPLAPAAITSDSAVPATHPTPEPELSESPPRSSPSVQRKREPRARRQVPREKRAKPKPAELQVKESSPSPQSTTAGVVKETPLTKDKKPSDVAWRARVLSCVDVLLLLAPMAMLGSSRLWNYDSRVFYDVYCSWPYASESKRLQSPACVSVFSRNPHRGRREFG